jgi:AbrB family looped-hinge helix DNA binding protein
MRNVDEDAQAEECQISSPLTSKTYTTKVLPLKLTSKGQVTIPQSLRKKFGLLPATEVSFEEAADGVLIKPAASSRSSLAERWIKRARGSATAKVTTDEILRLTRGEN